MINLKDFKARRNLLETWYDRVLSAGALLHVDDVALREAKANLHAGRFIVAICGQMNSGKSTLLNALLFGGEVLPSATTTTTAKVTLMEGSTKDTKESVEATLYTPDEFRRVVDESNKDRHAAEELSIALESARAKGLQESQLLTDPARVEQRAGLDDLDRFAAVSDKGGTYNVYVKSVLVRANRPWLNQVTVADTPGTNDPNPERDRITREWIQRADAVVYVTFAGQAGMDNEDVKFIDDHLAHVSPTHRLIAVNKCDGEPDTEAIWRHIRKTRDSVDLRMKSLFGDDDQIVLVSGLGALIAAMHDAGRALSEEMRWHAKRMLGNGYLDAERHGVEKLRNLIERRIIANKGEHMIKSHQKRIAEQFERAIRRLADDDDDSHFKLDAMKASNEDRAKEKERLRQVIRAISGHVKRTMYDISNKIDELHDPFDNLIVEVRERVMQNVEESLRGTTVIEGLAPQAHWAIQAALFKERSTIAEQVRVLVDGVENKLNRAESAFYDELMRSGFGNGVSRAHLLPVSARTICKQAEGELIAQLDGGGLTDVVIRATNWWQRLFDTAKGKKAGIESLRPVLRKGLKDALAVIPDHTGRELKKLAEEAVKSMEERCQVRTEIRQGQLEALEQKDASDDEMRAQINKELADVAEQKQQVKALQVEYEAAVPS